jgi:hypothetical protein
MWGGQVFSDIWAFDLVTTLWTFVDGPIGDGFLNNNTNWPSGRYGTNIFGPVDSALSSNGTTFVVSSGFGYGNNDTRGGLSDWWFMTVDDED